MKKNLTKRSGRPCGVPAAEKGHEALALALFAAGADTSATDENGETPLRLSERHGHTALVAVLTQAVADQGAQILK